MMFRLLIICVFSWLLVACDPPQDNWAEGRDLGFMPLKADLEQKKASFQLKADQDRLKDYQDGIEVIDKSGLVEQAIQLGEKAPNFTLNNAVGKPVELYDYLKKGKVILTWYRGGWCPYCSLTLHHLQKELPNFKANGANLLALTPELPNRSITTAEKHALEFEVLSDIGNKVGKQFGIVYKMTDAEAKRYDDDYGVNSFNGDTSNELPLAATYIIDEQGTIIYAFLDADYSNRAEPSELTAFLKVN